MTGASIFMVESAGNALVVTPQRNISSLAEEELQPQWEDILQRLRLPEIKHVVFDFAKLDYFGSSMLEAMLYLWKEINESGGKLAVCNVSETAGEILKLSRFETIWPICEGRDAALELVND